MTNQTDIDRRYRERRAEDCNISTHEVEKLRTMIEERQLILSRIDSLCSSVKSLDGKIDITIKKGNDTNKTIDKHKNYARGTLAGMSLLIIMGAWLIINSGAIYELFK